MEAAPLVLSNRRAASTCSEKIMKIPILQGNIARRILLNFRAEPAIVKKHLPANFRPKLQGDYAIFGVCLIRLQQIRPQWLPLPLGLRSENAALRIAVRWDENGIEREGVFIPRRDTSSRLNHWTGGRIFPGQHHLADFYVRDTGENIELRMQSRDGKQHVRVCGHVDENWPASSCFANLSEASRFFEAGSLGYSVRANSASLDGLVLQILHWQVEHLAVSEAFVSDFADTSRFPSGSVQFDHALLMRNIAHQWHAAPMLHSR